MQRLYIGRYLWKEILYFLEIYYVHICEIGDRNTIFKNIDVSSLSKS